MTYVVAANFDNGSSFFVDELGEVGGQFLRTLQATLENADHFRERVALVVQKHGAISAELKDKNVAS